MGNELRTNVPFEIEMKENDLHHNEFIASMLKRVYGF